MYDYNEQTNVWPVFSAIIKFCCFFRHKWSQDSPYLMASQGFDRKSDWSTLVKAARQGDDDAFGQICDRMTEYLLLTASDIGNGLTAKFGASDIVQQSLLQARQGMSTFKGTSEGELRTWLVTLVQRNLIDSVRHYSQSKKRDTSREQSGRMEYLAESQAGLHKTASSIVRQRETDEELLRAVAQLPTRRQRVIELRHWQGMSFAEISNELKISESAARQLLARALEELRKNLSTSYVHKPIRLD
ncbi:MAG: sigma-70 family RNA polymerase sigma factor [Pirellulales bacterium]